MHPPGFIEPSLPTNSRTVPTGPYWAYEIKPDGFRFICRREALPRSSCKFLAAFGYVNPALCAVAIDVHFRIEPSRVVESPSFDEPEFRHYCEV
jgi:hypothetical protein